MTQVFTTLLLFKSFFLENPENSIKPPCSIHCISCLGQLGKQKLSWSTKHQSVCERNQKVLCYPISCPTRVTLSKQTVVHFRDFFLFPTVVRDGRDPHTLGSGTLVCDTSTQMGHFRAKWAQNYSI